MILKQYYLGCLAHASYLLGDEGSAAAIIVDPQRDVEQYLADAERLGLTIRHVFLTHFHADFVAGHLELRDQCGATIHLGARAEAEYRFEAMKDGDTLEFPGLRLQVLETPGHTIESISILVFDRRKNETKPYAVLTGDTLFIGDVGRPDLRASLGWSAEDLGAHLYDSLHTKLLALPDEVLVYPAHGAGSLCGRNMRADRFSTIGTERMTNYALQIKGRDEFVEQMTANLPARPEYFFQDAQINRQGAQPLGDLPPLRAISAAELKRLLNQDQNNEDQNLEGRNREDRKNAVFAVDVRPVGEFAEAHVPRSINIALSGQFATWAASVLGLKASPVLIADTPQQYEEARVRMARVGIEDVRGYLDGGLAAWKQAGFELEKLPQITAQELQLCLSEGRYTVGGLTGTGTGTEKGNQTGAGNQAGTGNQEVVEKNLRVLDVRREPEWQAGHIAGP